MLPAPMPSPTRAEHELERPPLRVVVRAEIAGALLAAAHSASPREVGALLTGRRDGDTLRVEDASMLDNVAADPERHFTAEPLQFVSALAEHEARGLAFAGFAHSHPHGNAHPSAADVLDAWPGSLLLLVAPRATDGATLRAHWRCRAACAELVVLEHEAPA